MIDDENTETIETDDTFTEACDGKCLCSECDGLFRSDTNLLLDAFGVFRQRLLDGELVRKDRPSERPARPTVCEGECMCKAHREAIHADALLIDELRDHLFLIRQRLTITSGG